MRICIALTYAVVLPLLVPGCKTLQETLQSKSAQQEMLAFVVANTEYPPTSYLPTTHQVTQQKLDDLLGMKDMAGAYRCVDQVSWFGPLATSSTLVHELVHHLQCLNGENMDSPESEREARRVQQAFIAR